MRPILATKMNDNWQGLALKDQIDQTILKQNLKIYIKEEKIRSQRRENML